MLTNPNDIRPETGNPADWIRASDSSNSSLEHLDDVDFVENDLMTSMLTAAQLSTIPRYWLYSFSSNWFFYLSHFRNVLQCWPSTMDPDGDIMIELKSHCKRCAVPLEQGQRFVIYKELEFDPKANDTVTAMFDADCIEWKESYIIHDDSFRVECQLTDHW